MTDNTSPVQEAIDLLENADNDHGMVGCKVVHDALDILYEMENRYVFDEGVDETYSQILRYGPEPFNHDDRARYLQTFQKLEFIVKLNQGKTFREDAIYAAGRFGIDPAAVDWVHDAAEVTDGLQEFMAKIDEVCDDGEACCDLAEQAREVRENHVPKFDSPDPEDIVEDNSTAEDLDDDPGEERKACGEFHPLPCGLDEECAQEDHLDDEPQPESDENAPEGADPYGFFAIDDDDGYIVHEFRVTRQSVSTEVTANSAKQAVRKVWDGSEITTIAGGIYSVECLDDDDYPDQKVRINGDLDPEVIEMDGERL